MLYTFMTSKKSILVIILSLNIFFVVSIQSLDNNLFPNTHLISRRTSNLHLFNLKLLNLEIKHHNLNSNDKLNTYQSNPNREHNNRQEYELEAINQQNSLDDDFVSKSNDLFHNNDRFAENKQYLNIQLIIETCKSDRGCQRKDKLNETYLSYCNRYKLENLFSDKILMSIMHENSEQCQRILNEFIQLDELINHFDNLFANLLTRYNCHNGYSVKWTCEDCQKAYKDWLCATNLPYYMNGEQIKPCISFCERVEQRCPYLHPIQKEQYGGQPTFICRDPNIPFVPEITPDIPYSEPSKCYDLCHLSDNLTELVTDSLSKYDFDKCPDRGSIAEEVRRDQLFCGQENHRSPLQSNLSRTIQSGLDKSQINSTEKDLQFIKTYTTKNDKTFEFDLYTKKLKELRQVLAIYKSQPKTHSFGSSHD